MAMPPVRLARRRALTNRSQDRKSVTPKSDLRNLRHYWLAVVRIGFSDVGMRAPLHRFRDALGDAEVKEKLGKLIA